MPERRFWVEAVTLVLMAVVCATVYNAISSKSRHLKWVGSYSNATTVPPKSGEPGPAAPGPAVTSGLEPFTPAEIAARFPATPDRPYVEISGEDAARLHLSGALFLDARRSDAFAEGHIAGARSFPVWESEIVDPEVTALGNELVSGSRDASAPIVVYCTGGACEDSHMLAEKLFQVGYNDALVYKDGFPDWEKRHLPTETGGGGQ